MRKPTEIVSILAAAIACVGAVVSARFPALYTYTSRNRELDIKLVEIGVGILRADPKEAQTTGAREWAIQVIEDYSNRAFSPEAKREPLEYKLGYSSDYYPRGYIWEPGQTCTFHPTGEVTCETQNTRAKKPP